MRAIATIVVSGIAMVVLPAVLEGTAGAKLLCYKPAASPSGTESWFLREKKKCKNGEQLANPNGVPGAIGPMGQQGTPGIQGNVGPAGAVGPMGPVGAAGQMGPAGPPGPAGVGAMGETGATGPTGAPGPGGATGAAGEIGLTGMTGATGMTGPTGPSMAFFTMDDGPVFFESSGPILATPLSTPMVGPYIVTAKLVISAVNGANTAATCHLMAGPLQSLTEIDSSGVSISMQASPFTMTLLGSHTVAGPDEVVQIVCSIPFANIGSAAQIRVAATLMSSVTP